MLGVMELVFPESVNKAEKKALKVNFIVTFVGPAETTSVTEMAVLNTY